MVEIGSLNICHQAIFSTELLVYRSAIYPQWKTLNMAWEAGYLNAYIPPRGSYTNDDFRQEVDQLHKISSKYQGRPIMVTGTSI